MKLRMCLTALAVLASSSSFATVTGTPGQCGANFDLWDLDCDGKISVAEGRASQKAYKDEVAKVHNPTARSGLVAPSKAGYPSSAITETTGAWKKVSSALTSVTSAGAYSSILTPDAAGTVCALGTKGLILYKYPECDYPKGATSNCLFPSNTYVVDNSQGYKAECQ